MTYLEEYLTEHQCTVEQFYIDQEDYDGFCPDIDYGEGEGCLGDCELCWNSEIK